MIAGKIGYNYYYTMSDTKGIEYILEAKRKGLSFDDIEKNLIAGGWSSAQAHAAVLDAQQRLSAATLPNPFATSAQVASKKAPTPASPSSPFGSLLKVVLLLSLYILISNALFDLQNALSPLSDVSTWGVSDPSISGRLLVSAGVSLAVWLVTIGLYGVLKKEHTKYRALLDPYYMISGWLTLSLFVDVSRYVLDKNTTLGVYVSLALLIVVFTLAVLGFQKYSHRSAQS